MSPEQYRAARGWLRWSQQELADRAKVALSTLKDFENRTRKPIPNKLAAIKGALEAAGIEFTDGDVPGVRLRKKRRRDRAASSVRTLPWRGRVGEQRSCEPGWGEPLAPRSSPHPDAHFRS